ncbi:SLAP domain-containing protein [Brevibacillus dissolubilis]|uniref:SLAP domain-containing protein n=1 Tax=Brevibacillus dissolubilis TaxID=1844116 RepID=UPI00159B9ECF|nr:SLAP domain-containing protein [Brevibacillus dissolubilis]
MPFELCYETKWAKALSAQDDELIRGLFASTPRPSQGDVELTPIRTALNHRGELLATVLVQNGSEDTLTFADTQLRYVENGECMAVHHFTISALVVGPKTATPWTFIFPKETLRQGIELRDGRLEIGER